MANELDTDLRNLLTVIRDTELCASLQRQCAFTLYSSQEFEQSKEIVEDAVERARRTLVRRLQSVRGEGKEWAYTLPSDTVHRPLLWLEAVAAIPDAHTFLRSIPFDALATKGVAALRRAMPTLFLAETTAAVRGS